MRAIMIDTLIDTLKVSKRLEEAGIQKKAADELVEVMKEIQEDSKSELATKQDVTEVKRDIKILENKMDQKFELMRSEIRNAMLMIDKFISFLILIGGYVCFCFNFFMDRNCNAYCSDIFQ